MQRINMFSKISILAITLAVGAFSLQACTNKAQTPIDTAVVGIASSPTQLDPRFATDAYGMRISALIFSSFVKIGQNLDVVGDLARTWTVKGNQVEFKLNPNVKFANGRELTKEDLEFSIAAFQNKKSPFSSAFKVIKSIDVTGSNSEGFGVKLSLSEFSAKFLTSDLPVLKILPKKEVEEQGEAFAESLIGTGAFKYVSKTENEVKLAKNTNYFGLQPKVPNISFKVIRDDFTRFQKMLRGELDVVQSDLPLSKIQQFETKSDKFSVFKYPGLAFTYILLNLKDPELKKLPLRQAISSGINRKEIIQYKLEGFGKEASSMLTPENPYFNSSLKIPLFNVEAAAQKVKDLGLSGKTLTLKTSSSQEAVAIGKVIVNQLNKIGLQVKLQSFEWGTFYGDIKEGRYQMATMRWVGAIDPDIYRFSLHSKEVPPGRNRGYYSNKKLDQIVEKGLGIRDERVRKKHYLEAQRIVLSELPIIPLWYNEQVSVIGKNILDYQPALNGDFSPLQFISKKK